MLIVGPGTDEVGKKSVIVQAISRKAHVFALRMTALLLAKPDVNARQVWMNLVIFIYLVIECQDGSTC